MGVCHLEIVGIASLKLTPLLDVAVHRLRLGTPATLSS